MTARLALAAALVLPVAPAHAALDGRNPGASYGRGLALCAGCHARGVDFLLSGFRP